MGKIAFMLPNLENQPNFLHEAFSGEGIVPSLEIEDAKA
jgi:hypothetical protein